MSIRSELTIWLVAASCAIAAGWTLLPAAAADMASLSMAPVSRRPERDTASLRRAARDVVASDPFRIDREPAPLPFAPHGNQAMPSMAPPHPPKPILVLRGIVGGPPWEALIDGFPGRGPSLVRPGDEIADLVIRAIKRDSVIVQGMDTTWRLGVARSWQ